MKFKKGPLLLLKVCTQQSGLAQAWWIPYLCFYA